ncbi:MAG: hypothetical protein JSR33_06755 [Proteobacteria bacterium]|nr:hypothetical protein [Pseudomonadota bacterium]
MNGNFHGEYKFEPLNFPKPPNLRTWKSGKGIETKRGAIISREVDSYLDEIKGKYQISNNSIARDFYNLINNGFAKPDQPDGWEVFKEEAAGFLNSKGKNWDNPEQQQKDIKNKMWKALWAKRSELFYSGSTTIAALYSLFGLPIYALIPYGALLTFLFPWSAINNYNGIDPADVLKMIAPGIRIGSQKIIGTDCSEYHETEDKDSIHFKLVWDDTFLPDCETFDQEKLKMYNKVLRSWFERKARHWEWPTVAKLKRTINFFTFFITNNCGGIANGLIVQQFLLLISSWLKKKCCDENEYCNYSIESFFFMVTLFAINFFRVLGYEYYDLFTTESIEHNLDTFCTSDNAITETSEINPWGATEARLQYYSNGFARAATIGLGSSDVTETGIKAAPTQSNFDIKDYPALQYTGIGVTGLSGLDNTLNSRMKGADKFVAPVTFDGPVDILTIKAPDLKIFGEEIKRVQVTPSEKCWAFGWSMIHGASWGIPLTLGLALFTNTGIPGSIAAGVGLLITRAFINFNAETRHVFISKLRAAANQKIIQAKNKSIQINVRNTDDPIQDFKAGVQEALKRGTYDINGNEELTVEDVTRLNLFLNMMDQLQRILGRGGSVGQLLGKGATITMILILGIIFSLAFITPAICELQTYAKSTLRVLIKWINHMRELAGTPLTDNRAVSEDQKSELKDKGCCTRVKHSVARGAVYWFSWIFQKEGKPVAGITNVPLTIWWSGWWNYTRTEEKPTPTPPVKGCLTRCRERLMGRMASRPGDDPLTNGHHYQPLNS